MWMNQVAGRSVLILRLNGIIRDVKWKMSRE